MGADVITAVSLFSVVRHGVALTPREFDALGKDYGIEAGRVR